MGMKGMSMPSLGGFDEEVDAIEKYMQVLEKNGDKLV